MRALFLIPALALAFTGCQSDDAADVSVEAPGDAEVAVETAEVVTVGDAIPADADFLSVAQVVSRADELDGQTLAVEGVVGEVCQQAGCWLTMRTVTDETFRINVPKGDDGAYAFTFPTDVTGAQARLVGAFEVSEESVETLRHLAEDGGASADEVAAITAPRRTLTLTPTAAQITRA